MGLNAAAREAKPIPRQVKEFSRDMEIVRNGADIRTIEQLYQKWVFASRGAVERAREIYRNIGDGAEKAGLKRALEGFEQMVERMMETHPINNGHIGVHLRGAALVEGPILK